MIVSSAEQTGGSFTSPALQAGDIVVVTLATVSRRVRENVESQGWVVLGQTRWHESGIDFYVCWKRAAVAGSLSGDFTGGEGDGTRWLASVVVRGHNAVSAWEASRQNAQTFTYPGVTVDESTPQNGDVVYSAIYDPYRAGSFYPSGATVRQSAVFERRGVVSTSSFTGATELPAAPGTGFGGGWAVTAVVSSVAGPDAPEIVAPVGSTVDLAAGFDVSWVPSGAQTGFAVRVRKGSGAWAWWDGDGFDAASETVVSGSASSIAVPAGELTNSGDVWTVEVATRGDASRPELGQYATRTYVGWGSPDAPTVSVSDSSGGVLSSFTPTISLAGSVASGASGPEYHVQVVAADGEVLVNAGILAWDFYTVTVDEGADLSRHNREDVTVVGWTVQNGEQYSAPTEVVLRLDVVTPAAPDVTVSAYHHEVSGVPGTLIEVEPQEPMTGGLLEVVRVTDDARDVIHAGDIALGWEVVDHLAPTSQTVRYEARVTTPDAIPLTSPWGESANVAITLSVMGWLVDVLHPETSVPVIYQEFSEDAHGTRANAYQPLGSSRWMVHTGGRVDPTSQATVATLDSDTEKRAVALLTSGRPVMIRMTPEREGDGSVHVVDDIHFRVTGDVSVARVLQTDVSWRKVTFPYVHVDAPGWGQP